MANSPAVEARGLRHAEDGAQPALRGIGLRVPRGRITALVGSDGAGKSILLRILTGNLRPDEGTMRILDVENPAALLRRKARAFRRRVGYAARKPALDPEMSGREILELLAALYGLDRRQRREKISSMAITFGLAEHLGRPVATLTMDQRRRLHVAAAMIHDPELLGLDEPATGLDPTARAGLWNELERRATRGGSVLVATRNLEMAERYAGFVVFLGDGEIVAAGPPSQLVTAEAPNLAAVYRRRTGHDLRTRASRRTS